MVQIGFKCDKGVVRGNNEDACFVIPSDDVYIVADGVGGNNSGEVASRTAVSSIALKVNESNLKSQKTPEEIFDFFAGTIGEVNKKIYLMGREDRALRGMATTIVLAYIRKGEAYIANVGDSRAYLLRNGALKRITRDHTYVNELVDKGVITEEEAEHHSQRNVITKALGAEPVVEPDYYKFRVFKGDILLLCSDGLYGEVPEAEIAQTLQSGKAMNQVAQMLVDQACQKGGRDNITVICVKI